MNKKEFIEAIADKTGKSKVETTEFVEAFVSTVEETLVSGDSIRLIGFGTFEVRERGARTSRNPRTGEKIEVAASKAPAFKAGASLKKAVNK